MNPLKPIPDNLMLTDCIVYALVAIVLLWSAYKDWKTYELPIVHYPALVVCVTIIRLYTDTMEWIPSILGLFTAIVTFGVLAVFFKGGGGDIIMMAAVGWCIGTVNLGFVIFSSWIVYLIGGFIYCKIKKLPMSRMQLPFAPAAFVGMILFIAGDLLFHIGMLQRWGLYY